MNHSIYSVDRSTHLKIVVVALVGAVLVAGIGVSSRLGEPDAGMATARLQGTGPVIKAGKPVALTDNAPTIR
jgi:hypothetical protein